MDAQNSMNQAPMTVDFYLDKAIKSIDQALGAGYAKDHPELVSAYIRGCIEDYKASRLEDMSEKFGAIVRDLSESINSLAIERQ